MSQRFVYVMVSMLSLSLSAMSQEQALYVSDAGNFNLPPWKILKFDPDGTNGKVFISTHLDWPQDIVFLEKDTVVLISNLNSGQILRFNANTGVYLNAFASGIGGPTRMKIGADSLLYVLQWEGNGRVWRYKTDGTFVDQFTETGVETSIGIDWDTDGNLYVSSYNGKFVEKYSPTGADLGKIINTNLAGPTNLWIDASGDILVNDYNAGVVKRFGSEGNFKGNFITGVPQCEGVDFLPNGEIILGVGGTSSVRVYNATGTIVRTIVPSGTLGLLTPNAAVLRTLPLVSGTNPIVSIKDMTIVSPSAGIVFHITKTDFTDSDGVIEVSNASGALLQKISLSYSDQWDASDLPDGIYYLTLHLSDQTTGRQKIVVLHQ